MSTENRRRGLEAMAAAYGWPPVADSPGEFFGMTADHLFAEVWTRPHLSQRDRRLLLVGALMASGDFDVLGLQIDAARRLGELDPDQLREIVIFLAHYVGWPRAAKLNSQVEELLAQNEGQ
ncbi:MAG TPA: carboxymuconolactone decarboxylase family protein [Acidimicrobiales bacterium]|nr:carboxymuconolactone decarboxylase family protein [Acidimicrobiales bacterium]